MATILLSSVGSLFGPFGQIAGTLAGSAIGGARRILRTSAANAPLRRNVRLDEIGAAALYLLSDLSAGVTGEVHSVDCGYRVTGMAARPPAENESDSYNNSTV